MNHPNMADHLSCKTKPEFSLQAKTNFGRFLLKVAALVVFFCLIATAPLRADTISGTVKDPSGAVVADARIEITGGDLKQPLLLSTDESGQFAAPDLGAGKYSVRVSKSDQFAERITTDVTSGSFDL